MCNTVTVDYSRAVVRGILRGLTSYNILLNPKYACQSRNNRLHTILNVAALELNLIMQ